MWENDTEVMFEHAHISSLLRCLKTDGTCTHSGRLCVWLNKLVHSTQHIGGVNQRSRKSKLTPEPLCQRLSDPVISTVTDVEAETLITAADL